MTNILFIHDSAEIGGRERDLLDLWANLDRRRFKPFFLAPRSGPLTCRARAFDVETLAFFIPSLRLWTMGAMVEARKRLDSVLKSRRIDLIHTCAFRDHILAAFVGRRMGVPVVWHEQHLPFGAEWDRSATFSWLPDAIIANSQTIARRFQQWGNVPQKVHVVYNGVDTGYFLPRDTIASKAYWGWSGRPVVGVIADPRGKTNGIFFLEMAASVASKIPRAVFVFVSRETHDGRQEDHGWLKEAAARAGISGQVIFAGHQEDLRPYLGAFDVHCSVAEHEACPRGLIEAMAMGKPSVALRDGVNPEIVNDGLTGMLVGLGDRQGFSSAVQRLLGNDDLRLSCSVRARTRAVEKFDVRRNTAEIEGVYLKVLGKKGQR